MEKMFEIHTIHVMPCLRKPKVSSPPLDPEIHLAKPSSTELESF